MDRQPGDPRATQWQARESPAQKAMVNCLMPKDHEGNWGSCRQLTAWQARVSHALMTCSGTESNCPEASRITSSMVSRVQSRSHLRRVEISLEPYIAEMPQRAHVSRVTDGFGLIGMAGNLPSVGFGEY